MDKITSFTIDHLKLLPGLYVSRKDIAGDCVITTFDIRMTRPNYEPVLNTAEVHTIEHLGATFRTGFYMVLAGDYTSKDILPLVKEMYLFMKDFEGDVPGACAKDCGNYLDMNLNMAKYVCNRYYNEVLCNITNERLAYPE